MTISVRRRPQRPPITPVPSCRIQPNAPTMSPACAESSTACPDPPGIALGAAAALRRRPSRSWAEIEMIGFSLSQQGRLQEPAIMDTAGPGVRIMVRRTESPVVTRNVRRVPAQRGRDHRNRHP
jgi:hypothetical protein